MQDSTDTTRFLGGGAMSLTLRAYGTGSTVSNTGSTEHTYCPIGSGSYEVDSPFLIIAMEEEDQARNMHNYSFRERESITDKTSISLTKRIIPALYMCCFTCFFAYLGKLLFWNYYLISTPKIRKTMSSSLFFWNSIPQLLTSILTSISYRVSNNLSCFATECNPYPHFICFFENK